MNRAKNNISLNLIRMGKEIRATILPALTHLHICLIADFVVFLFGLTI